MRRSTVDVLTALAAVALFAALWSGVAAANAALAALDDAAIGAAAQFGDGRPGWITAWDVFCTVLGPAAFRVVAVIAVIMAIRQRNPRAAALLSVTIGLAGLLTQVVKEIADRPRPAEAFVDAHSTSFPSGHAVGVAVGVVALLTVAPAVRRRGWLIGAAVIAAVGVGRVVLCVHYPSDVLAGWALGLAYVLAWRWLLRPPPLRWSFSAAGSTAGTPATPGSRR